MNGGRKHLPLVILPLLCLPGDQRWHAQQWHGDLMYTWALIDLHHQYNDCLVSLKNVWFVYDFEHYGHMLIYWLTSGRCSNNLEGVIFQLNLQFDTLSTYYEITLRGMLHITLSMVSQQWFNWLLTAIKHQANTWFSVDKVSWSNMASEGNSKLKMCSCWFTDFLKCKIS